MGIIIVLTILLLMVGIGLYVDQKKNRTQEQ